MNMYMWYAFGLNPKAEYKYNFTFDEEVFEDISFTPFSPEEGLTVYYIGNLGLMGDDYENTGENYFLYLTNSMIMCATEGEEGGEHKVALELIAPMNEKIHKLNSKYLDVPYETQGDTVLFSKSIELPEDIDLYYGRSAHSFLEAINKMKETSSLIKKGDCYSDYYNSTVIGENEGSSATGIYSLSLGTGTYARGAYSKASGYYTAALGESSTAEGDSTIALGSYSHAEGRQDYTNCTDYITGTTVDNKTIKVLNSDNNKINFPTISSSGNKVFYVARNYETGQYAVVESWTSDDTYTYYTLCKELYNIWGSTEVYLKKPVGARGYHSHIEGFRTSAMGSDAHAEGRDTIAYGEQSHAEGNNTLARNSSSHSEGYYTIAKGNYSHVEGEKTLVMGTGAHAEGCNTVANGQYSHAEGVGSETPVLQGTASIYAHDSLYIADANYSDSKKYIGSKIVFGLTDDGSTMKEPIITTSINSVSSLNNGVRLNLEQINDIDEDEQVVYNIYNTGIAQGDYSHSEGACTFAGGDNSHSEGEGTIALGRGQHVQGRYNEIDNSASYSESNQSGKYAHIVGNGDSDTSRSNAHTLDWNGNAWYAGSIEAVDGVIVKSSTSGSTKRFKIRVDDSGTISAIEV